MMECERGNDMDKILMPKELTAENGAKALLIGDFSETVVIDNCSCTETGDSEDAEPDCEYCDGTGQITINATVSWTTIKAIYAKAVEYFDTKGD